MNKIKLQAYINYASVKLSTIGNVQVCLIAKSTNITNRVGFPVTLYVCMYVGKGAYYMLPLNGCRLALQALWADEAEVAGLLDSVALVQVDGTIGMNLSNGERSVVGLLMFALFV